MVTAGGGPWETRRHRGEPIAVAACLCLWSLFAAARARAEDLERDAVYLPAADLQSLEVRNPLGAVKVSGWDRPEVRVIAEKRAGSRALLERLRVRVDVDGRTGTLRVTTGFTLSDGAFTPLPLAHGVIDLTIDTPRQAGVQALSYGGDVEASGLRAGARLSSQSGRIRATDVNGQVDTRSLSGAQWLETIRGELWASGVLGDVELADIQGARVDATVYRGQIIARDVSAGLVRLHTAQGSILLIGALRGGYDVAAQEGEVRLQLRPAELVIASAATAHARKPWSAGSAVALPVAWPLPTPVVDGERAAGAERVELRLPSGWLRASSGHGQVVLEPLIAQAPVGGN